GIRRTWLVPRQLLLDANQLDLAVSEIRRVETHFSTNVEIGFTWWEDEDKASLDRALAETRALREFRGKKVWSRISNKSRGRPIPKGPLRYVVGLQTPAAPNSIHEGVGTQFAPLVRLASGPNELVLKPLRISQ